MLAYNDEKYLKTLDYIQYGLYICAVLIKIKMKKTIYLGMLLSCMAISCSQDLSEDNQLNEGGILPSQTIGLTEPELLSIVYDSDNELSELEVTNILSDFITENNVSRGVLPSFILKNKETINEKVASTPTVDLNRDHVTFYEYETDNQSGKSKAIVCGDKRFPSVIAYMDSYDANTKPAEIMVENAKQYVLSYISQIKHYEDSLRIKTFDKIRTLKNITGELDFKDIEHEIFIYENANRGWAVTPGGTEMTKVGPLTTTRWDQVSPYNLYADTTIGTSEEGCFDYSYDNRYPAGCAVIAMAQIAAYFKPSMSGINWSLANVPYVSDKTSAEAKAVASVVSMIAKGSGTTYGADGGSTNTDKARNYMKNFGIYMDDATDCTFQNMKSSFDALRLVYISGTARHIISRGFNGSGRHAWIADGYQIRQRNTAARMILKQYNVYCHCNFGWGGSSDGWYLYQTSGNISFDCNGYPNWEYDIFDYDLRCYPNVRKG